MIIDDLRNAETYRTVHPLFWQGMEYLRTFDIKTPKGRYELDGDRLFALVQHYQTKLPAEKRFESHQLYADVQYVARGAERLWYFPREGLQPRTDYEAAKDVQFHAEPAGGELPVRLKAGGFAVLYPHDGHKPGCVDEKPDEVIKVVLKIRLR